MRTVSQRIYFLGLLLALGVLFPGAVSAQWSFPRPFFVWNEVWDPLRDERGALLIGENPCNPDWSGQTGDLVQVIYAGDDGVISPPDLSGNPTGDDSVFHSTYIGCGNPWSWSTSGRFCAELIPTPSNNFYARAFNGPTLPESSFYGDSTIFVAESKDHFPVNRSGLLATDQPLDDGDDDGDGANNSWEKSLVTDKDNYDTDGDGLLDGEELAGHTLPLNRQNLGLPDVGAITFNVADPGIPVTNPKSTDTDGDTFSDYVEVVELGSDPTDPHDPYVPTPTPSPTVTPTPPPTAPPTPPPTVPPTPQPTAPGTATPTPASTPSPQPTAEYLVVDGRDYNGDGRDDTVVWQASSGKWAIDYGAPFTPEVFYFGRAGDIPASGDYDGDGMTDPTIFRPDTGLWAVAGISRFYFGTTGDIPAPADFSGDGVTDPAIFRPATGLWAVRGVTRAYFGRTGDLPIPKDFAGTGKARIGVFRPASGLWAVKGLTRAYFGTAGDYPVPADYTGDELLDPGIFRPATGLWAVPGMTRLYFGRAGDFPQPGDYAGSGIDRPAVYRPATGLWAIRGVTRIYWGGGDYFPVSW